MYNLFLDRFRALTSSSSVHSLGRHELALLTYEVAEGSATVQLYGGGITVPIAGLLEEPLAAFMNRLQVDEEPSAYELAILDADRTVKAGAANAGLIVATSALEGALDAYFTRAWRSQGSGLSLISAALEVGVNEKRARQLATLGDVLAVAPISAKLTAFVAKEDVEVGVLDTVRKSIESRNLAVHTGLRIPYSLAVLHVQAIQGFLANILRNAIIKIPARDWKPSLVMHYEEATGERCPLELEQICERFLTSYKLDAILSTSKKDDLSGFAQAFGSTIVVKLPLEKLKRNPRRLAFALARSVIYSSLQFQGSLPRAEAAPYSVIGERRHFFTVVAQELTRSVWETAIFRLLGSSGYSQEVVDEIQQQAQEIEKVYGSGYVAPPALSLHGFLAHADLARLAVFLTDSRRVDLLRLVRHASPSVAAMADQLLPTMSKAKLDDPGSLKAALLAAHDLHPRLLASVQILDPITGQREGNGYLATP